MLKSLSHSVNHSLVSTSFMFRCGYLSCLPVWKCTRSATVLSLLVSWKYSVCSRWLVRLSWSFRKTMAPSITLLFDSLIQWLKVSKKEECELCGTKFRFTPIYHPSMPPGRLPLKDLINGLLRTFLKALRYWLHYLIVAFCWLGVVLSLLVVFIGVCSQDQSRRS